MAGTTALDVVAEGAAARNPAEGGRGDLPEIPILDLFAGAGGLSLGLEDAGFRPIGAVEIVEDAARTYETSHDIEVDRRRLEDVPAWELRALRGKVQVVVGGPPCQPWSTGGLFGSPDVSVGIAPAG